jgi:hypothetical protein
LVLNILKKIFNKKDATRQRISQNGEISIGRIKNISEKYYRDGDFFCSEAIVKTIKDEFHLEISDDAIAISSGFPVGVGGYAAPLQVVACASAWSLGEPRQEISLSRKPWNSPKSFMTSLKKETRSFAVEFLSKA